jgi:hypothetical protein
MNTKGDQFRPIKALSLLFKYLKFRFMPSLQTYLTERMDRNQTGSVPGLGTSVNIELLVRELRNILRKLGQCCVFINFKSAYNTIRRDLL